MKTLCYRNDVFLEPYLQQHGTVQVVSTPSTSPPNPLQHQLTQLHHVQVCVQLSQEYATCILNAEPSDLS